MKRFLPIAFIFTLFMITFVITIKAQSSIAVVNPSGTTTLTESFKTAVESASNGDIIYLPTGTVNTEEVVINKTIHFIGAGYCPDSTGGNLTNISGNFIIADEGSSGSLTGVRILTQVKFGTTEVPVVKNYTFFRCCFRSTISEFFIGSRRNQPQVDCSDIYFKECIFDNNWTYVNNAKKIYFEKCVFLSNIFNINGEVTFTNCNFLFRNPGWALFNFVNNAIIKNCIISQDSYILSECFTNTFNNNLFCGPTTLTNIPGQTQSGNTFNHDTSKVYTGIYLDTWSSLYNSSSLGNKLHLKPEAKAIKGGDGTEVGIYGSSEPFKDGAAPPIPLINSAKVSTRSNAKGKLDVEIKVKAQSK
ncbi:MAG: hypothetical protein V1779_03305 [bacterium]